MFLIAAPAQALTNLALTGSPSSSSQGYGTVAADGNDGNRNGNYAAGSVFHTQNETTQSYWQVNLGGVRHLDHIRIFSRVDAVQGSVANFRIIARNGATEVFNQIFLPANATDQNNARAWGTANLRGVQADFVRIERVSQTTPAVDFLTFAEFEVWGSSAAAEPLIAPSGFIASPAGFSSAASDASDGDINGNLFGPGTPVYQSLSQAVGNFWEMTLPTDYVVKSLLLFNRVDAVTTTNVRVKLLDTAGATVWTQDVNISPGTATPFNYGFELTPNTTGRRVRVETLANEFLALAEVQAFGAPGTVGPPVVENQPATNVTAAAATLRGIVTDTGFQSPSVKIYYGTSDGGTIAANWQKVADLGPQFGAASANVAGLSPTTQYFFRAFAENSGGSDWADTSESFTTQAVTAAAIEVVPAIGITGYTALLNGRVISAGNDAPVVTIYWGTIDGGTNAAAWQSSASLGVQTGAFGQLVPNLSPDTVYFHRAAAANAAGTTWTASLSFRTTIKPPIVINEIHYKPADRTKTTEFIELANASATAFDVSGWRLLGGVDYLFPAGTTIPASGFLVVAANSVAFQSYYGFAAAGQWLGTLKNSGETIELRDAANVKVDDVDYAPGFPWPTSAAGGGASIELINPGLENDLGGAWRSSKHTPLPQTPGAPNSVLSALAPPAIRGVIHTPNEPAAGQDVLITARISDANGVAGATLEYQPVNPGAYIRKTDAAFATSWTSVAMNDTGTDGDAIAGDGIFSAVIPAALQTHRRLVRYRISAADALGTAVTVPYADDEQPNFAYFVYNGLPSWNGALQPGAAGARGAVQSYPSAVLAQFAPWHFIAQASDVDNSQYNAAFNDVRFFATLAYDGKVYDHIHFKNRGKGSTYVSGKNKWGLYFNRARDIRVKDNWGRYYQPWNSLALDANASPWCAVHRGSAGVEEAASYRMFDLAGVPALRTSYVHWRVIDNALESGATQYDGDLWGLYLALEPMEGNYLTERGLPDGNVYDIEGSQGDKKHQGPTQPADASDWNTFNAGVNAGGQAEAWYRANIDLPALYTFFALGRFNGNVDVRPGDNVRFYHRPADNRWVIAPYDLDMMFVCGHHWSANIDGVTYAGVTDQFRAITRHPAIATEFRNRARELLDLLASDATPNGGQVGQLIDEYAQLLAATGTTVNWAGLDAAMWNLNPHTTGSGAVGSNSGYSNHKNNFFRTPYFDNRGVSPVPTTNWTRTLSDPDANGYSDFAGLMTWFTNYTTNTWTGGTWARSNGNQNGYGYKYLEWESLYGGLGLNPTTPDLSFPNTPTITYAGPAGFPANALDFSSSPFSPSTSGGTSAAAVQWRIGELYAPGITGYVANEPRKYEVEDVWTSAEVAPFVANVHVPVVAAKPGHTYRARVRHKDANGRWSHWSAPLQFIVGAADVSVDLGSLVVSEVSYNPGAATAQEIAGFGSDDFEWIEVKNVSDAPVNMSGVRFTKGINFDFPDGYTMSGGGFALVVKNLAAFQKRYGHGFDAIIAGSFPSDNLSNSGEEVKLSYGAGTPLRTFTYSDQAPWPVEADGTGRTLVLKAPNARPDHALPTSWRASVTNGGSPGSDDASVYATWKTEHGITNDNDDADGDGLSAFLEYVLGSDPAVNSPANLPAVAQTANGNVSIAVTQALAADDVTFTIETSLDLVSWAPAAVTLQSTAVVGALETFSYTLSPSSPPDAQRFVRVIYKLQ